MTWTRWRRYTRCPKCRAKIEECSFCEADARHFIDGPTVTKDVYFCDKHVELLPESLRDGAGWADAPIPGNWELGAYMPGEDGCVCDTWA